MECYLRVLLMKMMIRDATAIEVEGLVVGQRDLATEAQVHMTDTTNRLQ